MKYEIDINQLDKCFGVVWVSTDGRLKTRWHHSLDEAQSRVLFLRKELGKDVGIYVLIGSLDKIKKLAVDAEQIEFEDIGDKID